MKIAVLGDVHGNLGALDAVLRDARECGARRFWCVGDVVGYGADPNACCELVRKLPGAAVAGNHDHACAGLISLDGFSDRARASALWTRRRLSPENRSWLRSIPLVAEPEKGVQLVHGSLDRPSEWNYLFPDADPTPHFASQAGRLCFVGHTHVPAVFAELGGIVYVSAPEPFRFEPDGAMKVTVNVGSVGEPRDEDPRPGYVLYDASTGEIEPRRVETCVLSRASRGAHRTRA